MFMDRMVWNDSSRVPTGSLRSLAKMEKRSPPIVIVSGIRSSRSRNRLAGAKGACVRWIANQYQTVQNHLSDRRYRRHSRDLASFGRFTRACPAGSQSCKLGGSFGRGLRVKVKRSAMPSKKNLLRSAGARRSKEVAGAQDQHQLPNDPVLRYMANLRAALRNQSGPSGSSTRRQTRHAGILGWSVNGTTGG